MEGNTNSSYKYIAHLIHIHNQYFNNVQGSQTEEMCTLFHGKQHIKRCPK